MKTTLVDVAVRPKDQLVRLPTRGPIALRYVDRQGKIRAPGGERGVSRGLAETYLQMAGYVVEARNLAPRGRGDAAAGKPLQG